MRGFSITMSIISFLDSFTGSSLDGFGESTKVIELVVINLSLVALVIFEARILFVDINKFSACAPKRL